MSDMQTTKPFEAGDPLALVQRGGLLIIVAVLCIGLALTAPKFATYNNLYSLGFALSIHAIAIIGFTYVMVMGEIDLSVGAVFALTGTITGWLVSNTGLPLFAAGAVALFAAFLVGLGNGLLVTRMKINSLMLTIGTMIFVQGLVGILVTELSGTTYPRAFRMFARERWFGVNSSIWIAVVLVAVLVLLQYRAVIFRRIYLIGSNERTSVVYGTRVARLKTMGFVASAMTAGMGGIYTASRITHADTKMGLGLEFTFVTAAVLGGASLFGGKGGIFGAVLGLFFLAVIQNGMVQFNINPLAQQVVVGVLLILAVLVDVTLNRKSRGG